MPNAGRLDKPSGDEPLVSIVVPALDEEVALVPFMQGLLQVLGELPQRVEIVLVDDGSTDGTGALMEKFVVAYDCVKAVHNPRNLGLGKAYLAGIRAASGTHAALMCGDGGLPPENLRAILSQFGRADIVVPYVSNLKDIKTPFRYLLSKIYKNLLNSIFGLDIRYYNAGALLPIPLIRKLDITTSGFGFQAEMLIKLIRAGCTYVQVPVVGAEATNRSQALRLRNLLSVGRTFFRLVSSILLSPRLTINGPVVDHHQNSGRFKPAGDR